MFPRNHTVVHHLNWCQSFDTVGHCWVLIREATSPIWMEPVDEASMVPAFVFCVRFRTTCWAQHLSPGNKFEDENFEWQSQTNRVFWFVSTWNCSCSDGKHRKALQNVPKCNMQSVIVLVHVGNGPSSCIPDSVAKRDVNRLRWTLPKLLTTGS